MNKHSGCHAALRASGAFEKAIALEELDMADVIAQLKKFQQHINLRAEK